MTTVHKSLDAMVEEFTSFIRDQSLAIERYGHKPVVVCAVGWRGPHGGTVNVQISGTSWGDAELVMRAAQELALMEEQEARSLARENDDD